MVKIDFPDAEAGIHSIFQFCLAVPDLDEEQRFLTAFGLDARRRGDTLEVRTEGNDHIWAVITKGASNGKSLQYISLGCYESDYEKIKEQVARAGGVLSNGHPAGQSGGFWFKDPDGLLLQVIVAPKTQPDSKSEMPNLNVPPNVRGAPVRSELPKVKSTRLSHMAMFTKDVTRTLDFYTAALGLRLSDRSGEVVAFTHARHGSDHHLLAFAAGPGRGLHHSSWDMPSFESLGRANTQLRAAGYNMHWGPGRHVLGSNYFNYTQDKFGQWWENSAHIDYIEKDANWESADFHVEDAFYLFGPDVPPELLEYTEVE